MCVCVYGTCRCFYALVCTCVFVCLCMSMYVFMCVSMYVCVFFLCESFRFSFLDKL